MELQNQVRKLRQDRHLTQEDLAAQVDVTRQTIIAMEKGGYTPSVKLALLLARSLDVSLDDLFWLEETRGGES